MPEFSLLECANVLWKEVRFRGLSQTKAEEIIVELLALPFQIVSVTQLLPRALQIGLIHQLAVYDSLYIALALDRGFPLITVDDKQLNAAVFISKRLLIFRLHDERLHTLISYV